MFHVCHYNLGQETQCKSFAEAKAFAVKACFEAAIYEVDNYGFIVAKVATFSPIRGWRDLR